MEISSSSNEAGRGKGLLSQEHGVPPYDELIYITSRTNAQDPRIAKFLGAVEAATVYLLNHPDESWKLFVKANPKLDDELDRQAWTQTLPQFVSSPSERDPARYERFADYMKARGLIDQVEPVERYIGK